MPSPQRGQVLKQPNGWAYRYRDAEGRRQQHGRFTTRREAVEKLEAALREVRNGPARRELTVAELCEEFLAQHVCEPNSMTTLRARLRYLERDLARSASTA